MNRLRNMLTVLLTTTVILTCLTCYAALPDEEFSAESIYLGDTIQAVRTLYGEPVSGKMNNAKQYVFQFRTPNGLIEVTSEDNQTVCGLFITNEKLETGAFIKLGSTKEDIIEKYGEPTFQRKDFYSKADILTYSKPGAGRKAKKMIFWLENNKVKTIRIIEEYET